MASSLSFAAELHIKFRRQYFGAFKPRPGIGIGVGRIKATDGAVGQAVFSLKAGEGLKG